MSDNKHLTPVCIIYVDGRRLDTAHEGALRSVMIKDCLNDISEFEIVFDESEIEISEAGFISFESEVSIRLGYKDDVGEVFFGVITDFKYVNSGGGAVCTVGGFSFLYKLNHCKHYHSFENKSISLICKDLIESYSLQTELDDFGATYEFSKTEEMSDYEYLFCAAITYGKQLFADGKKVYIKNEITVRNDEIIYEAGKNLVKFETVCSIKNLISSVSFVGWDVLNNHSFVGEAVPSDIPVKVGGANDWTQISNAAMNKFSETFLNNDINDIDSAKQLAIGRLQTASYNFGSAEGLGEGNYKLRPGMRVNIKSGGAKSDGEYIADVVTHSFDYKTGYTTKFNLKRNMLPGEPKKVSERQERQGAESLNRSRQSGDITENNADVTPNGNISASNNTNDAKVFPVGYDVSTNANIVYYYEVEKVMHIKDTTGKLIMDHSEVITYFSSSEENTNKSRDNTISSYARNDQLKKTNEDPVTFMPSKPRSKLGGKEDGYIIIGKINKTQKTKNIPNPPGNGEMGSINGRFNMEVKASFVV